MAPIGTSPVVRQVPSLSDLCLGQADGRPSSCPSGLHDVSAQTRAWNPRRLASHIDCSLMHLSMPASRPIDIRPGIRSAMQSQARSLTRSGLNKGHNILHTLRCSPKMGQVPTGTSWHSQSLHIQVQDKSSHCIQAHTVARPEAPTGTSQVAR